MSFKGGIATRLALVISLVALVATATVGYMVYSGARDSLINSASERVRHTSETIQLRTFGTLNAIGDDVKFLATTPPVKGIVRAKLRGGLDPMWSIYDDEWGTFLADLMKSFLESRSAYLRARFISLAEDGSELVRVERSDGRAEFADPATLRSNIDAPYVHEAAALPAGQLYYSDVVRSDGEDDIPLNLPILHIATPVLSDAGAVFGVMVVTVDFMEVIGPVRTQIDENQTLYVTRSDGEILLVSGEAASGMPPGRRQLQDMFPRAAELIAGEPTEIRIHDAQLGKETLGIVYFEEVALSNRSQAPSMIIGVSEPHESILAGVRDIRNESAAITFLLCLAAVVVALVTSRRLTNPLRRITKATSSFGDGDRVDLPVERDDEIGVLARSFEAMQAQIEDQIRVLEDEERRQRTILETAAEGIIVTDAEGRIETFNPAAESIFDRTAGDVSGQTVDCLLPHQVLEPVTSGKASDLGTVIETDGYRADGTRVPVLLLWSAFEWRGARKITFFVQDITERKEAEQAQADLVDELEAERRSLRELSSTLEQRVRERTVELERLNRDLEASNRELREIAKVASHDLQEPLRKLRSFADLLETEYAAALDQDGRFYVRRIFQLAERMSRLIGDLLAFSRVTSTPRRFENVDLCALLQEVVSEIEQSLPEVEATFDIEPLPTVAADPLQMRELFTHLVDNAVTYRRPDIPPQVHMRCSTGDGGFEGYCRIEIADNGVGFDQKYVDRIFAPFERLVDGKRHAALGADDAAVRSQIAGERSGTGMGLTICRRIVENHGGSITAQSTPGQGSTFVVTLPLGEHSNYRLEP